MCISAARFLAAMTLNQVCQSFAYVLSVGHAGDGGRPRTLGPLTAPAPGGVAAMTVAG
jgi:hypothetical protein